MKNISKAFADLLSKSNGKFVTLTFIKEDGSIRKINCRTGVTKYLKGGACTVNLDKYLIVYDIGRKGYRSINKETITSISIYGEKAALS